MYQTSLYYLIKPTLDKKKVLELFFQNWADSVCNDQVTYETVSSVGNPATGWQETIRVDFTNPEDASVMKLQGVPADLQQYLEIVN